MLGVLLGCVLVLLTVFYFCRSPSNLPPGPTGVPILGYLPFLGPKHPQKIMDKLCKKYGPVMSLYFGSYLTVVLGDIQVIRKALHEMGDVFSGRPHSLIDRLGKDHSKSLVFAEGPFWAEHRRFALTTLKDFGIGKSALEPMILTEVENFVDEIHRQGGAPFDPTDLLFMSICNNICVLEFGRRFEYSDPKFQGLLRAVRGLAKEFDGASPDVFLPWIRNIPGVNRLTGLERLRKLSSHVHQAIVTLVKEHRLNYQTGNKTDYIDAFITEAAEKNANNSGQFFDGETLYMNLRTFFVAGTDTTATTLLWALLFMVLHPDIQRKVQQEIDDVIGRERMPSMEDRPRMAYTEATLMEVHRRSSIVPLSVPHSVTADVSLNGYHIPKGTYIFPNLWAVHNDPQLYPDPESFRPERFINRDGKVVKPEHLVPFGIGKRFCVGEPLARMELFLYFTSMLQKFTLVNPEGAVITTEATASMTERPLPYTLCAVPQ